MEYRHKYLSRQHIISVQPAKAALPVRILCEQLPKVFVFSADEIFTTLCTPFFLD